MKKLYFSIFLLITSIGFSHPIIILLSHPRSLSTACERIMRERGDFTVFHEPFTYLYYLENFPDSDETSSFPDYFPKTAKDLIGFLKGQAQKHPVFVKDMAFASYKYLLENQNFINDPDVKIILLKRDPIKALTSLYKIYPEADFEFIGYEALYKCYKDFPYSCIIDADDLESSPPKTYQKLCSSCEILYIEEALFFKKEPPKDWEGEWYQEIKDSSQITKSNRLYLTDEQGRPLFPEMDEKDKELWLHFFTKSKVYYLKMK